MRWISLFGLSVSWNFDSIHWKFYSFLLKWHFWFFLMWHIFSFDNFLSLKLFLMWTWNVLLFFRKPENEIWMMWCCLLSLSFIGIYLWMEINGSRQDQLLQWVRTDFNWFFLSSWSLHQGDAQKLFQLWYLL